MSQTIPEPKEHRAIPNGIQAPHHLNLPVSCYLSRIDSEHSALILLCAVSKQARAYHIQLAAVDSPRSQPVRILFLIVKFRTENSAMEQTPQVCVPEVDCPYARIRQ